MAITKNLAQKMCENVLSSEIFNNFIIKCINIYISIFCSTEKITEEFPIIKTNCISVLSFYLIIIIGLLLLYKALNIKYFKIRALLVLLIIDFIFSILNYLLNVNIGIYYCIQSFYLLFALYCKCFSYIKSNEINDENVCLIFYKPKKFKQFLYSIGGLSYSSAGLVINKHIYQMRYEAKTLQEIPFREGTEKY